MATELESLVTDCDAPAYAIVDACGQLGFRTPLDVRWCQSPLVNQQPAHRAHVALWKRFFGIGSATEPTCSCGHRLPRLERCTFILPTQQVVNYLLGQCPRCRTIFWHET
jgi:hypothetical protein